MYFIVFFMDIPVIDPTIPGKSVIDLLIKRKSFADVAIKALLAPFMSYQHQNF